jgi:uridine phosphorylase
VYWIIGESRASSRPVSRDGMEYEGTDLTWAADRPYRGPVPCQRKASLSAGATRKADGCLTVEMERAALAAVAEFRGVTFGQLLATGDDVSGDQWHPREWGTDAHVEFSDKLFWLAVESCLGL